VKRLELGRWVPALFAVTAAVVAVVVNYAQGNVVFATVLLALVGGLAWWSWPGRKGSHLSHADAQANASDDDIIVYWRPG